jgi:Flp pilus assembly pilin Flp
MSQLLVIQAAITGWFKKLGKDELGASLVEYALLLALIAVVAITALIFLGGSASNQLNNVANHINNA